MLVSSQDSNWLTHWCSIWKLRWPRNQSAKNEDSALQVPANWRRRRGACGGPCTTCTWLYLHGRPVGSPVEVNGHWEVADLSGPCEPVALQKPTATLRADGGAHSGSSSPDKEVKTERGPEPSQQSREHPVPANVEQQHPQDILSVGREGVVCEEELTIVHCTFHFPRNRQ